MLWASADSMIKSPEFSKEVAPMVGAATTWKVGKAFADSFKAQMVMNPAAIDWLKNIFARKYGLELQ